MKAKISARLWFSLGLLFALLALLLPGIRADHALLLFAQGSPEETADLFFRHLEEGDYALASELCLPALSAESYPEEPDAARLYDALCASRRWQREGAAVRRGDHARVSGSFRVLDPIALCTDMNADVNAALAARVARAQLGSEVFDENGSYKDEVVIEAWNTALDARLGNAEAYMRVLPLTLELVYRNGSWLVKPDEALMRALSGGVA